jgi:hypothetical protein
MQNVTLHDHQPATVNFQKAVINGLSLEFKSIRQGSSTTNGARNSSTGSASSPWDAPQIAAQAWIAA